jgi:hypothetical protein
MLALTLVDHLRLTFGHVVYRHKAHVREAHLRARWSRWLRASEALLMAGVAFAAVASVYTSGRGYAIAAALLAMVALTAHLVHLSFDLDRTSQIHAACASRLWRMREQYRSLLSDLADGALDLDAVRHGRDALMAELQSIYDSAPPGDSPAYQPAAKAAAAADEIAMTDEEIDLFLPKSLQKTGRTAA